MSQSKDRLAAIQDTLRRTAERIRDHRDSQMLDQAGGRVELAGLDGLILWATDGTWTYGDPESGQTESSLHVGVGLNTPGQGNVSVNAIIGRTLHQIKAVENEVSELDTGIGEDGRHCVRRITMTTIDYKVVQEAALANLLVTEEGRQEPEVNWDGNEPLTDKQMAQTEAALKKIEDALAEVPAVRGDFSLGVYAN